MPDLFEMTYRSTQKNREKVMKHPQCGCLNCQKVFATSEIVDSFYEDKATLICPHCWTDSVVPWPITEEVLTQAFAALYRPMIMTKDLPWPKAVLDGVLKQSEMDLYLADKEVIPWKDGIVNRDEWKDQSKYAPKVAI